MSRKQKRQGISLGTVVMLVITLCVCAGLAYLLPALHGNKPFALDTGRVLSALSLTGMPELALSDIPIHQEESVATSQQAVPTYQPQITATSTPAATATLQPTATPDVTQAPRIFTMAFTGSVEK